MIEISSQMREFVNFAQDAVANNAKNSIARLGKQESRYSAFAISAATDGDSVGKLRRSAASKDANNTVRTKFRDAYLLLFAGVAMAGLNQGEKERMSMIFATDASKIASNTMQALVQDSGMDPVAKTSMQDMAHMMRECTTFLADDLAIDADIFAVNHDVETMTFETIPADVAAKFTDLVKEM